MQRYIVYVLRRGQPNRDTGENSAVHLDGVVEAVDEGGGYRAFHSVDERWSILAGSDKGRQSKGGAVTQNGRR